MRGMVAFAIGIALLACGASSPLPEASEPWRPVPWQPSPADARAHVHECIGELRGPPEADELGQEALDELARAEFDAMRAAFEIGEYERALVHVRRAVQLSPQRPGLLANLGVILERLGRYPEAARCLERYLRAVPDLESNRRRSIEERISRLRQIAHSR